MNPIPEKKYTMTNKNGLVRVLSLLDKKTLQDMVNFMIKYLENK